MTIDLAGRPGSYRPPRVPAYKPTAQLRKSVTASMRKLGDDMRDKHPDLGAHEHIADAARALDRGQHDAAIRHLNAAIGNMQPQSLRRHGLLTDDQHDTAKRSMDAIHRHLLLVRDIQDMHQQNSQLPHADEGTDDLTDVPTARQPGGDRALNAPARTNSGGPDPNVAKPQAFTSPKHASQIAAANSGDLTVDLSIHFNPLEKRNAHGEWTREDASEAIRDMSRHKEELPPDTAFYVPALISEGRLHDAADELDKAGTPRASELAGRLRAAHHYDPVFVHRQERDMGVDPDPGLLADAHNKSNTDLEHNLVYGADPRQPSQDHGYRSRYGGDPQVAEAARRELSDRRIIGEYAPGQGKQFPQRMAGKYLDRPVGAQVPAQVEFTRLMSPAPSSLGFSADTARLASTPHPFGRPGGPGLWHVKGMELPPYIQNIARALLRTGRAKTLSQAIAIAKGATNRWERGGGHVHPEVRAASAATNVDWNAKRAIARAHANGAGMSIDLVGPKGYVHGWRYVGGPGLPAIPPRGRRGVDTRATAMRGRGFGSGMVQALESHQALRAASTRRAMPGEAGTHEHAEELRQLARESDRIQVERYSSPRREGPPSFGDLQRMSGLRSSNVPASATSIALRRAADMIDRGQPSLARAHASALRESARYVRSYSPGHSARLSAAADKLTRLPMGQGLAANPPETANFRARTEAARRYASTIQAAIERSSRAVELAGPHGYVHGWIKVGSPEQAADLHRLGSAAGGDAGSHLHMAATHVSAGRMGSALEEVRKARALGATASALGGNDGGQARGNRVSVAVREHEAAMAGQSYGSARAGKLKARALARPAGAAISLTGTAAGAAKDTHAAAGSPAGGQFAPAGSGGGGGSKQAPAKGKPSAHQQHVAHVAHVAHEKHVIAGQIRANQAKIGALVQQRRGLLAAMASASGKISRGQAGSRTATNATTATNTTAAAAAAAAAAKSATTAATATPATAASTARRAAANMTRNQIAAQITAINGQINALQAQDVALAKKAAALH